MLSRLAAFLPAGLIRYLGWLQFRHPFLREMIRRGSRVLAAEGVIQRGAGKGLRFDGRGANPGYLAGTTEPEEQKLLARVVRPGTVLYDIGANAGFYAVIGARMVGSSGRVFAFEPTPALAEQIRRNVALNDFKHVEVVEAAVSDRTGMIAFRVGQGVENRIATDETSGEGAVAEVAAITLDAWSQGRPAPDVILMDIEGAELAALRGGLDLIRRSRPVMMVEVHWLREDFARFVRDEMEPLGYRFTTYGGTSPPTDLCRYHALLTPSTPLGPA